MKIGISGDSDFRRNDGTTKTVQDLNGDSRHVRDGVLAISVFVVAPCSPCELFIRHAELRFFRLIETAA